MPSLLSKPNETRAPETPSPTGTIIGKKLAPLRFSTEKLPRAEQFEAWREFTSPVAKLSLVEASEEGFDAEQDIWDLGCFVLTSARMPGEGYLRSWRHLAKDPLDHWCLVLYESEIPGVRAPLGFRSLAQPFFGVGSDRWVLTLFIPRDLFADRSAAFDSASGDIPETGISCLLADYLQSLERQLRRLSRAEVPAVAEATRALLAACFAPTSDSIAEARAPILRTTLERARRTIRSKLQEESLTPAALCRALGVSRARLYRLFEEFGGVSRYIQRQRLLAAFAALSDANDARQIAQIAESFGFPAAVGFSRAFRSEFGFSPTEARAVAHSGRLWASAPPRAAVRANRDLGAILRGLQA
jgi:AraC-like DNA-binding protein